MNHSETVDQPRTINFQDLIGIFGGPVLHSFQAWDQLGSTTWVAVK